MVTSGQNNCGLGIGFWENDHPSGSAKAEDVAKQGEEAWLEGVVENQPAVSRRKG